MMKLELKRIHRGNFSTIGDLYLNGERFSYTLEDPVRDIGPNGEGKVFGETAIPAGTYKVIVNESQRFGRLMPRLLDVPHFTGILIHKGNTPTDTHGCILVGKKAYVGEDKITESTKAWDELFELILDAVSKDEEVWITVTNEWS